MRRVCDNPADAASERFSMPCFLTGLTAGAYLEQQLKEIGPGGNAICPGFGPQAMGSSQPTLLPACRPPPTIGGVSKRPAPLV